MCFTIFPLPALLQHLKTRMKTFKLHPGLSQQVRRELGFCLSSLSRAYGRSQLGPSLIQILFRLSSRSTHCNLPLTPRDCLPQKSPKSIFPLFRRKAGLFTSALGAILALPCSIHVSSQTFSFKLCLPFYSIASI